MYKFSSLYIMLYYILSLLGLYDDDDVDGYYICNGRAYDWLLCI